MFTLSCDSASYLIHKFDFIVIRIWKKILKTMRASCARSLSIMSDAPDDDGGDNTHDRHRPEARSPCRIMRYVKYDGCIIEPHGRVYKGLQGVSWSASQVRSVWEHILSLS